MIGADWAWAFAARSVTSNPAMQSAPIPRRMHKEWVDVMLYPSLGRRRLVRQRVGQFWPDDDAAGGFLDDVAATDRQVVHAAADRDRAATGDAFEPVSAAGDLEVAVAAQHVDALATQLGIDPRAVLAGDGAAALTLL